jgi:hypothetical protein
MIYQEDKSSTSGWAQLTEPDAVKAGYFIQVAFSVDGNGQQDKPRSLSQSRHGLLPRLWFRDQLWAQR